MNQTDIINSALNLLDSTEIVEVNEDTNEARIARRYYETAVDAVLSNSKWRSSVRVIYPSKLPLAEPQYGYTYTYLIDPNIIRITTVYNADNTVAKARQDYARVGNKIYSSSDTISLEASTKIDVGQFTPMMTEALYTKLAVLMATALTGPASGLRGALTQQYEDIVSAGINEIAYEVDYRNIHKSEDSRRGNNYDL